MAEIVSDIAIELISKLGSFAFNEIGVYWGLSDELDKLKRTVGTIEAVLLHAEEQAVHSPQVKNWLGLLSEAFNDADDLLDELSTEALRKQLMGGSEITKKVRLFFSSSNQLSFGLKMGHKVKALRERLDEIAAEKSKFHLEEWSYAERRPVTYKRDQTHSYPPEIVIGREPEKEEIVRLLLSSDYDENVSVASIVGLGGLGKTTLAQMVYNDDRVDSHFELKIWVCVSNEFDVKLLVKKVLESITREEPKVNEMDPLKNLLHEKIGGRRYLLVLDDVWNEDLHKWYNFKDLLVCGARGSRIVITTRLRTVAKISRSIFTHDIISLSENEAWSLFKAIAFKKGQLPNPTLEAMGKEIVAKCYGVPLAIKTIAGMLYFKDLEFEWLSFKENELLAIDVFKHDILPILKLSYNHLPSHYKHCFSYCSLFPKDYRIPVDKMIQLWNAQGYIKSTNSNECLHDVGFGYFMDLFRLSFFQDVEKDELGNIHYCKIHDLMHDLAISVAKDNFSPSYLGTTCIIGNTQHVSFMDRYVPSLFQATSMLQAKKLRTLVSLNHEDLRTSEADVLFCSFRRLRVLELSDAFTNAIPKSIYKLKHIRYIDFSDNIYIKRLPDSITSLCNLQVLKLKNCTRLVQLPRDLSKLVNLTSLDNRFCFNLSHMPRGIGKLTRLEKLSEFVIPEDKSISKQSGGLNELSSLNNLRGELEIQNLRYALHVSSIFKEACLSLKKKLQILILDWGIYKDDDNDYSANDVTNEEIVMEALCPHPNLKVLKVEYYRGGKPPSWLPSITNLVSMKFESCRSIQWLPPFNQLPHLKKLELSDLTKLGHIDVESGGVSSLFFPSLTYLSLYDCSNLKGFERRSTEELPCFPCLSKLVIKYCPKLTKLPLFPGLKKMKLDRHGVKYLMDILNIEKNSASKSTSTIFSSLSQLENLHISEMENSLENELLLCLPSLQHLQFYDCLFTNVCTNEEMMWRNLKALWSIEFYFMRNMVYLPKELQYLTTLQRLHIRLCLSLACIPEWMPKLTALQDLTIEECLLLEKRCENNSAEDWSKISHIPNIEIGRITIQRNGCYLL